MIRKNIIFTFSLLQLGQRDQCECINVSHSKVQFLAERNLRSTRDVCVYVVIYKPF